MTPLDPLLVTYGEFTLENERQTLSTEGIEREVIEIPDLQVSFIDTGGTMNALGGPKLEYLHQYSVKDILTTEGAGWAIEFENGAIVCNKDATIEAPPPELVGLALITTIFTATETTLRFGRVVDLGGGSVRVDAEIMVTLNPSEYTIIDPRFEGQDEHYPQRAAEAEATLDTIRQEFDARAAEAPEPPAEDDESAEEGELPRIG